MPIKDLIISFLQEKQSQLMKQYAEWEEFQNFEQMDRCDRICEEIRRKIYELEGENGKCKV